MWVQTTDIMKCNDTHLWAFIGFTDVDFSSERNLSFSMEDKRRWEDMMEGRGKKRGEGRGEKEEEEEDKKGEVRKTDEGSCWEGGIEEEEEVKVWIRMQLPPPASSSCPQTGQQQQQQQRWQKSPSQQENLDPNLDLTLREWPRLYWSTNSAAVTSVSPFWTNRHALPGTLRVSAGRVLRAVASWDPGGVLWVGADSSVPVHAVEHDQDAEPPPPQHPGQRGAGHRAVRGTAG